jgi:hydrogenase-4 component E
MNLQSGIDAALVLVLLLDLAMVAVARLSTCIRIFAFQCALLALLPPAAARVHLLEAPFHAYLILMGTIGIKVILIPSVLLRIIRTTEIHREVEPLIGFTSSLMLGAIMVAASFAIGTRLRLPGGAPSISQFLIPTAISTLLIGLLVLVSRVKAVTQVIGYLVLENGIFLFGLTLLHQMPVLVELGILLDVFVGVFVMAIVVYHIRREFEHMDTHVLAQLKEA